MEWLTFNFRLSSGPLGKISVLHPFKIHCDRLGVIDWATKILMGLSVWCKRGSGHIAYQSLRITAVENWILPEQLAHTSTHQGETLCKAGPMME